MILNIFYPFLQTFIIIFLIQALFFLLAYILQTDIFTDFVYGLTFIIVALFFLFLNRSFTITQITLFLMIFSWGARLGVYLFIRILKTKKDERFNQIRKSVFKLAGFWTLQAVTIFIIMLPSLIVLTKNDSLTQAYFLIQDKSFFYVILILGFLIWLTGFLIETIADWQKFKFKSKPENKGKWTNKGLFKYSRFPNYFGEMLCWWGIYIYTLPFLKGFEYLTIISPIYITVLLKYVSGIPILEKKHEEKYGNKKEFQKYKNKTSLLVPLPPKE
jgi:steroid 5-alpha reductase family enzyme